MSSPEIAASQTWKLAENPLSDHNLILVQTGEQALPMTHKYSINPHRLKKAARYLFNNFDNVSEIIERAPDKAAVDSAVEYLTEKLKETSASKLKVTPKGRAPISILQESLQGPSATCSQSWICSGKRKAAYHL
ncbi:hypothetical protein JTE90_012404 [Oedothorax gibbosus]|uniref:Endonuclease/exonuclease/phosphatase domain-containing protein n=1 Tax=Oedothorax gibbosus TaxID=931172 RepID=A0AAV6TWS2_9ARAC|nr:hypothetical protein JTE90_012404 [Oedothorax gibbosus]